MHGNERVSANFIDIIGTSICRKLIEHIEKCNKFFLLMDGSTDSSVTEQELIYVLFSDSKGRSSPPEVFIGKDVLKICSKFPGELPCQSVISIKLQRNFIKIALQHGCSPVNLLHIFRTLFS